MCALCLAMRELYSLLNTTYSSASGAQAWRSRGRWVIRTHTHGTPPTELCAIYVCQVGMYAVATEVSYPTPHTTHHVRQPRHIMPPKRNEKKTKTKKQLRQGTVTHQFNQSVHSNYLPIGFESTMHWLSRREDRGYTCGAQGYNTLPYPTYEWGKFPTGPIEYGRHPTWTWG